MLTRDITNFIRESKHTFNIGDLAKKFNVNRERILNILNILVSENILTEKNLNSCNSCSKKACPSSCMIINPELKIYELKGENDEKKN